VREVAVDFEFAPDQALFARGDACRFAEDFQRADVVCFDVAREVDAAEFAAA
jgi:hypothetical protein